MTEANRRRRGLFHKYSENLHLLESKGLLKDIVLQYDQTYICPICTEHFMIGDLSQHSRNPLTLEDVPPKVLGGKANVLTCKRCNNFCGRHIDHHLSKRMIELDRSEFLPETTFNTQFETDGVIVQGQIRIEKDGQILAVHKEKQNNPALLEGYLKKVLPKTIINLVFRDQRIDPRKIQIALLKIAYLMAFEKYGYAFILKPAYDKIRLQILNPDQDFYPLDFWFQAPYPKKVFGVPFVIEPGIECLMAIFALRTNKTERPFAGIIPLYNTTAEETIHCLKERFKKEKEFNANMDAMDGANYLNDLDAIIKMLKWIEKINAA